MVVVSARGQPARSTAPRRRSFVGHSGAFLIEVWRRVALSISVGLIAVWRALWPRTWRPTVRMEFVRHAWQVGIKALPATVLTGGIIGIALIFQIMYWRREFIDVLSVLEVGNLVLLNLVREISPLLVGLIIIGRSATVMITELVDLRTGGQIHMLDAQGIDGFDFLVVSRVSALAVCSFALGVVFVGAALFFGYLVGAIVGVAQSGLFEFLGIITRLLTPAEYLILPLKTLSIGVLIGVVTCVTALRPTRAGTDLRELVPLGFMRSVVATLILSGAITAMVVS